MRKSVSRRSAAAPKLARRHRPDVQILLYMALLMLLGLVTMFAIGAQRAHVLNESLGADYSDTFFFTKQLASVGLAFVAFTVAAVVSLDWILERRNWWLYIGLGLNLLLAFAAAIGWGIAEETYGATRWFDFGPISLQPAEVLKLALVIYLASFLATQVKNRQVDSWQESLLPVGLVTGLAAILIVVIQRDLGTGATVFAIVMTMLLIARVSWRNLALILGGVGLAGVLLIATAPHRMERVMTYVSGSEQGDSNYHIKHAKTAIGVGGLFGVGIGNSVQATGYLPEAINDSVFAIMGETFGFIGLAAIIALFTALLIRLIRAIEGLADYRLKLLASGVFGWLASHFVLNIGAMVGLIPLTGITLPLLSFGGTSMVFIAAALGLVFQATRYTGREVNEGKGAHEGSGSRRRVGRARHTSRSRIG